MGCCNEPALALTSTAPDPARHVNYAKGMVLGVDDFTQEFAYLSERDQWLARDAIGYGTLSGLKVFAEDGGADGPRLHVAAGSALAVSGKLICVPADQCCVLNKWLAKAENAATVSRLLGGGSPPVSPPPSPPAVTSGTVSLYLTLCYADCLTAPVPIPGEPCRTDDQLTAPSRIADDFCLALRAEAPPQVEEDALRDFLKWLKDNVQLVDASPGPGGDESAWLAALRAAVQAWTDALSASPPASPPPSMATLGDYLADLSPVVSVARQELGAFLRVAFRFWVTELRPMWMARRCHAPVDPDQDCVLLAQVDVPVVWVGGSPTGVWQVDGSPAAVVLDESARPFLVHTRLLQEVMLNTAGQESSSGGGLPQPLSPADAPTFAGLRTTGAMHYAFLHTTANVTLDASHHIVVCDGGITVTLPKCAPGNLGRVYRFRAVNGNSTLAPFPGDSSLPPDSLVGGVNVTAANPKDIVSDGNSTWYVL